MADRRLGIIAWLLKLFDWWSARRSVKAKREMQDEIVAAGTKSQRERLDQARAARDDAVRGTDSDQLPPDRYQRD